MITKNILYKYFKDFADNHLQIKDYGYGDLWEISSSTATTYPLFWVSPQPSNISGNEITYNFNILIGDRLEDGDANKVEVESDTFQIGLDLLATLNLNRDVDLDKSNTLTPFIHDFKDRIAGHLITLSVTADFDYNECAVPTTGTPQPPASSCPVAIITINGVSYGSVGSGNTEDIAVVDGSGNPIGSLVSGDWVVTSSCPNATAVLKNTLGTTISTTSIASGASSNIVAPDTVITINSAAFLTNPVAVNPNILVKDGTGTQVGSKVGSEWIVPSGVSYMTATGGTVTTDGDFKIHTFNSSGDFEVLTLGSGKVDFILVAGGGSGGRSLTNHSAGGGGAGGLIYAVNQSITLGVKPIVIGAGGIAQTTNTKGVNGDNSTFLSNTAIGGGGGASTTSATSGSGGSGGGGSYITPPGTGTAGQGFAGGSYVGGNAGCGGGGSGQVGISTLSNNGGNGGIGRQTYINGALTYFAGGGGGSPYSSGTVGIGGDGGGGNGGKSGTPSTNGTANTGGGGGGGYGVDSGAGGSGVCIIRYKYQ